METRKVSLPKMHTRALVQPETVNVDDRTVDVVFTTGASVKRNTFFGMGEDYIEELEVRPSTVRLERFQSGAPVLKDHVASVDSVIGVIERAKIVKGEGIATIRFSERDEADAIFRDVQAGVLRSVSVGYAIHRMEERKPTDDGLKVLRATDWEPMELSFVAVPADARAQVRSQDSEKYDCEIQENTNIQGGDTMPNQTGSEHNETRNIQPESPAQPSVDLEKVKAEAIEAERKRTSEIRDAVRKAKLDSELADSLISKGISVDAARAEILEKLASKDQEIETRSVNTQAVFGEDLSHDTMKRGIENALKHRANPVKNELSEQGRMYRNVRLIDMCRDFAETQGTNTKSMSVYEIAQRGLHSTSDFPELLANVANKTLRDAYEESPQTFSSFTRRVTAPDFKEISRTQLGDAPQLKEKLEQGEYEYGGVGENAEKYSVKTYGRMVCVSREAIVNDDLSAFTRLPNMFGRQAANLESDLIFAIINSNPNMADGNPLFDATHGNLAGAGAAISISTLGAGREAMRLQQSLGGSPLNLRPSTLLVPAALETVADQFTSQITPDSAGNLNPFAAGRTNALMVVAEPRLDDTSSTAWYLMSSVANIDIFELATLVGEEGPVIDSMIDFDTDGMKMKARHTVGVKAIDYRGLYKNPGA